MNNDQPNRWLTWLLVGILAFAGYQYAQQQGWITPSPAPTPDEPTPAAPTGKLLTLAEPLRKIAAEKPSAARRVAAFYRVFADALAGDPVVKTNGQLRAAHAAAGGKYLAMIDAAGQLGAKAAIENLLKQHLGDDNQAVDSAKAREAFAAIAWGLTP